MIVTKEEGNNIMKLCDVSLKAYGANILDTINAILNSMEIEEEVEDNG